MSDSSEPDAVPTAASLPLIPWEEVVPRPGLQGHFRLHRRLHSTHLDQARDVLIWLPPSYSLGLRRYPVIYMHDGNNLFDPATSYIGVEWQVDEHLQRLIADKRVEELIVVGIYNTSAREDEYTWTPMLQEDGVTRGGLGPAYARFVTEELKPMVDALYRTRPEPEHTGVAGSSLGGLISLYFGRYYSHVFGKIGILSPSLWWNGGEAIDVAAEMPAGLCLWIDMGTCEGEQPEAGVARVQALVQRLLARGYVEGWNLAFVLDSGARHDEFAWSGRIETMLRWFFGTPRAGLV